MLQEAFVKDAPFLRCFLATEPLAIWIRSSTGIVGFPIPGCATNAKITIYADDMMCFVSTDSDWVSIENAFKVFSSVSGSKLNLVKSCGLWVGSWRSRQDRPLECSGLQRVSGS